MSLGKTEQIIRRPTQADLDFIADHIREDDLIEVKAMGGRTIKECFSAIPNIEQTSWVWEYENKVMCIFGVNPIGHQRGIIWMLATEFFEDKFMIFASGCKNVFEDMIAPFNYVFNYVYSKNEKSINWLGWLGFKIHDAIPVGPYNEKFHLFDMWNEKCAIQ